MSKRHFTLQLLVKRTKDSKSLSTIELSVKYVQKRKLRANFIKTRVSTSQGAKSNLVVVLR
jgi:hypothetical protein